ncbi:MAG: helix-turn-helix domain-containing protein [Oscillospiraceae bacterium]|nr:helix-turn-helix domain-containing protein [Oscillospiraceae bacterium]
MANFSGRIKSLRVERGITQEQLAAMLKVSRSTIGMYESGRREPDFETSEAIADIFNVDMDYLTGRSDIQRRYPITLSTFIPAGFSPLPDMDTLPRVGRIACGEPILAEQNIEDYDSVPSSWRATFTLLCEGDSMAPRIQDGDLVAIRQQKEVENGEIAAVRIGDEATLKRVYLSPGRMVLQPENPQYEPIVLVGEELRTVSIEGRAVGFCRGL